MSAARLLAVALALRLVVSALLLPRWSAITFGVVATPATSSTSTTSASTMTAIGISFATAGKAAWSRHRLADLPTLAAFARRRIHFITE
jgi:hypothetical protein